MGARTGMVIGVLLASCATAGGARDPVTDHPPAYELAFAAAGSLTGLAYSNPPAWDRTDGDGPALEPG